MKSTKMFALVLLLMACVFLLGPAVPVFAATTVTVTPANPSGWYFYDDDYPGGVGTFVTGPAGSPSGTGSARMVLTGTARQTITTLAYAGTRFDKITNLRYYTYGSVSTLQFNIDFDLTDADATTWMGRLVYQPSGGVAVGSWTQWNPMSGTWYTTAGANKAVVGGLPGNSVCPLATPCTWAQVLSNYPNAGIRLYDGGIHIKAGGPAPGFDGNVDAFTIVITGGTDTTYDFEDGSTALVFVPDSAKVGVGGSIIIGINLNNVANLYGYQFKVNYDSSKVNASAWFGDSATRPVGFPPFKFFETTAPASAPTGWKADCVGGVCQFAVSHVAPQTAITGSGPLAFILLTGTNPGTFNLTFSGGKLADRNGAEIAHSAGTSAITVYGMATVTGSVALQGRATPINAGTVTLTDTSATFLPTTVNFDAITGMFTATVPSLVGGTTYNVLAAHSLYLGNQKTGVIVTPSSTVSAGSTTLLGGDADNSGLIDVSDLSCIGGAFGGTTPPFTCGTTGSSDINADTIINILDLVLAGGNYGLATPQPW